MDSKSNTMKKQIGKLIPYAEALISAAAFAKFLSMQTTNIFILLFAVLMYPVFTKAKTVKNKRIKITSLIGAVFFTAVMFFFKFENIVIYENMKLYTIIIYLIGFYLFFNALLNVVYNKILDTEVNVQKPEPDIKHKVFVFFGSMIIMLLTWLPYFLLLYPGDITADSISELNQSQGMEALSNHHPIAHTMMIKIFFNLGQLIFDGDVVKSVATYTVCQAILLSASFSYLIVTLYKFRVKTFAIVCVLLYFTLAFHGQYSVVMWKDIWFGGIVVAFSTTLWRLIMLKKANPQKKYIFEYIMLFVLGVGVCLFRSNGLYAFMFMFLFLAIYCLKKKSFVTLGISAASLVLALIIKGPVYNSMGVTPPDPIESLSLPAQQIAAVVRDKEITDEQRELLSNIVDVSLIPERYTPNISDSIKNLVRETDNQEYITEHKTEFLKLWIQLGLEYPETYIIAHVYQTCGYWFPDVQYWVYAGEFRNDNFPDLHKVIILSDESTEKLHEIRDAYKKYYYLGLFWSIGSMTWAVVFMMGASFIKKRKAFMLIYLPIMGVILTLMIATPVYSEFRYAYSVFTTVPLLCVIPFVRDKYIMKVENTVENSEITETDEIEISETEIAETENI
ncbi:MAG: hypothetical protein K2J47_06855 [Ruminococcus sp.]|nr:hypothetical protein [Ruminococcus sp.]